MEQSDSQLSNPKELSSVVIRFAGDSGDGIQVTGVQFTNESAIAGNDISTLPDFPAEIRAPAGTLAGVSAFQINFGSMEIHTPGDAPDVLVAMNPAALKANIENLKPSGIVIANSDTFVTKNLSKVGYSSNPLEDGSIESKFKLYSVPVTKLTQEALVDSGLSAREIERCKNFFTLGIMLWMFNRGPESTVKWISKKFSKNKKFVDANVTALNAGMTYAEATQIFDASFVVKPANLSPGKYRNINGVTALAYGFIAATQKSGLPLFFGAYPITPASDLLHELAKHKKFGITTFQAEDEIAAICAVIGASFGGSLAVTSSSGPGIALKSEAMGLAIITELPLVVVDIQRGGPSTGLPTKTEQSDLMNALYGRHGDSPICVIAASSPKTSFELAYEACRIAVKYMTPVFFLSEGFIGNSSEPWKIPNPDDLKDFDVPFVNKAQNGSFLPYARNDETLARPWASPGTPGLEHRLGGLEKQDKTGNVCYQPDNHQLMTSLRKEKIERIAQEIPPLTIDGEETGDLLVIGWGGTEGTLAQSVISAREAGVKVSRIHLHFLNPLPSDLGPIIAGFKKILIPEINTGQLLKIIRERYLVDAIGFNQVKGQPLNTGEVKEKILQVLKKAC